MELKHSYSAVKDYTGCRRRYHEVRILKKFKQGDTEATLYGTAVHKAFEDFVQRGIPLPPQFERFSSYVEPLAGLGGTTLCEHKMGLRRDLSPCEFFAPDVWFRGIPDFLHLNEARTVARVADYKTGKSARFADPGQIALMAAMVMQHYPTVQKVKGMLMFVVAKQMIPCEFTRAELPDILSKWAGEANMIEEQADTGVWNPTSGPLCRFCPVATCEYKRD